MVAKCIFTLPFNNQSTDIGIPVALESYSPYLMIVGTELGAILGFDIRTATKEVFRLQSDLKWGKNDEEIQWYCFQALSIMINYMVGLKDCLAAYVPTTIKTGCVQVLQKAS
jgi:hypothetical protein